MVMRSRVECGDEEEFLCGEGLGRIITRNNRTTCLCARVAWTQSCPPGFERPPLQRRPPLARGVGGRRGRRRRRPWCW